MPTQTPVEQVEELIEKKLQQAGQLPSEDGAGEESAEPEKVFKDTPSTDTFVTSYYTFPDNFTTNLKGSKAFLQISVGVSTQYDETVIENVESHQLALRSEVLGTVSEFSVEQIEGKTGRDELAEKIKDAMNERLEELEGFGGVEGVFFTFRITITELNSWLDLENYQMMRLKLYSVALRLRVKRTGHSSLIPTK